jgi:hypothetical protein
MVGMLRKVLCYLRLHAVLSSVMTPRSLRSADIHGKVLFGAARPSSLLASLEAFVDL